MVTFYETLPKTSDPWLDYLPAFEPAFEGGEDGLDDSLEFHAEVEILPPPPGFGSIVIPLSSETLDPESFLSNFHSKTGLDNSFEFHTGSDVLPPHPSCGPLVLPALSEQHDTEFVRSWVRRAIYDFGITQDKDLDHLMNILDTMVKGMGKEMGKESYVCSNPPCKSHKSEVLLMNDLVVSKESTCQSNKSLDLCPGIGQNISSGNNVCDELLPSQLAKDLSLKCDIETSDMSSVSPVEGWSTIHENSSGEGNGVDLVKPDQVSPSTRLLVADSDDWLELSEEQILGQFKICDVESCAMGSTSPVEGWSTITSEENGVGDLDNPDQVSLSSHLSVAENEGRLDLSEDQILGQFKVCDVGSSAVGSTSPVEDWELVDENRSSEGKGVGDLNKPNQVSPSILLPVAESDDWLELSEEQILSQFNRNDDPKVGKCSQANDMLPSISKWCLPESKCHSPPPQKVSNRPNLDSADVLKSTKELLNNGPISFESLVMSYRKMHPFYPYLTKDYFLTRPRHFCCNVMRRDKLFLSLNQPSNSCSSVSLKNEHKQTWQKPCSATSKNMVPSSKQKY